MSVASNKVTRRIALGSIAAGLGGAAVAMRVLSANHQLVMAEGDNASAPGNNARAANQLRPPAPTSRMIDAEAYAKEWSGQMKSWGLDIGHEEIAGPSTPVTVSCRLPVGKKFRVVGIRADYQREIESVEHLPTPLMCTTLTGQFIAIEPIADRPAIFLHSDSQVAKSQLIANWEICPGGKCIFVPSDTVGATNCFAPASRLGDYYRVDDAAPRKQKIPERESPNSCRILAGYIVFGYPQARPLTKGFKWTNPGTSGKDVEQSCEIVGFAKIGERETLVVAAKQHWSKNPPITVSGGGGGDDPNAAANASKALKKAKEEIGTLTALTTSYIDLDTGLCLRREERTTNHRRDAGHTVYAWISITQVFES